MIADLSNVSELHVKDNTLIVISSGEYSDYQVWGLFKTKKDFTGKTWLQEYLVDYPEQQKPYAFEYSKFINYLISKDIIEEVSCSEFYLGDYGHFDSMEIMSKSRTRI